MLIALLAAIIYFNRINLLSEDSQALQLHASRQTFDRRLALFLTISLLLIDHTRIADQMLLLVPLLIGWRDWPLLRTKTRQNIAIFLSMSIYVLPYTLDFFGGRNLAYLLPFWYIGLSGAVLGILLFFATTALALAAAFLLCRWIICSKVGRVLVAIRDAESRTRFLGYRVEYYKLFVFTLSAMLAGISGALYVPQVGIINPSEFSPANSIEIVVWVAVGGRGYLHGAILGAVLVNYAKTWLTGAAPDIWLFFLGGLFIAVTVLLPRGIVGSLDHVIRRAAWPAVLRKPVVPAAQPREAAGE
jgi:ABC-type branched-subunit amino acid transport system permease subunit